MNCPHCGTPVLGSEAVCMFCHHRLDFMPSLPHIRTSHTREMFVSLGGLSVVLLLLLIGPRLGWGDRLAFEFPLWLGLFFLLTLGFAALRYSIARSVIRAILIDQETLHWTYREDEWQQFNYQAWRRSLRRDLLGGSGGVALMLVLGLLVLASGVGPLAERMGLALMLIGAVVPFAVLPYLEHRAIYLSQRRQHSGDAYISIGGLIVGGWYHSWPGLERATYTASAPAVLRFFTSRSRSRPARQMEVLVPCGREAEAERLAQKINDGLQ